MNKTVNIIVNKRAKRVVEIEFCSECKNFDNQYFGYNETCKRLHRKIEKNKEGEYQIPSDCPLTNVEEL